MKVLSRAPIIKKDPITGFEDRYEIKYMVPMESTCSNFVRTMMN